MLKVMNASLFALVLISAGVAVHAAVPYLKPKGPMPDTAELAESALAPFMAFDGGYLYTAEGHQDIPSVCGAEAHAASRLMFPVTLKDLDRLYGTLSTQYLNQSSTASQAKLDMVEGCFLRSDGEDVPCVAWLHSNPEQCRMNIKDSTAYWASCDRSSLFSFSEKVFGGGADLFVKNVLWVRGLRERLRRSIRLTQESAVAGKRLWNIVSAGWEKNAIPEDQQAFREAVSARGAKIVTKAYADVMDKWTLIKKWIKPSVGEVEGDADAFATENGGPLLSSQADCNPSIFMDEWLNYFDQILFGYRIATGVEQEVDSLFKGFKVFFNKTVKNVNRLGRLPCVATSFAVAKMLFEDFPVRLAYWNMMNETESGDILWPLRSFAMLGDSNETVMRNRDYLLKFLEVALGYLSKKPHVDNIFDGNVPLAECVTRAILRAPGPDGSPAPSSLYECFSFLRNSSQHTFRNGVAQSAADTVIGLGKDVKLPVPPCPWGFTRPSGNMWNAQEACVMCPPGSFDDANGGCRCSTDSVPSENGCKAREDKVAVIPTWTWAVDPSEVYVTNDGGENQEPFLVVSPANNSKEDDRVVVEIHCSKGLTRFDTEMLMPHNSTSASVQRVSVPLQNSMTVVSTSTIFLTLRESAAFGGEQCDFYVQVKSSTSRDSPVVHAGSVFILPSISELDIHADTHTNPVTSSSSSESETSFALCNMVPKSNTGSATVSVCVTSSGKLALLLDTQAYSPLTVNAFGILKQKIWADRTQAAALGRGMQPMWDRMCLAIRINVEQRKGLRALKEVFSGHFPLARNIRERILLPDTAERGIVEIQIVDRCTAPAYLHDTACLNARLAFSSGAIHKVAFELPINSTTTKPEVSVNGEEQGLPRSPAPWWRLPLIVSSAVVATLLILVRTLLLVYRFSAPHRSQREEAEMNEICPGDEPHETEVPVKEENKPSLSLLQLSVVSTRCSTEDYAASG
ncbi:hypothetical protein TraAM80_05458 [Trypanosoma rangeli]|uniref:Transmembrane protein n=1 Tax=Trypanosoma rangeli TaxID=5698 RepID=A0A3R7KLJ4_TRYRA|nr:uncharacterized protein TraAM80_05458 [Trypanosoma rangeli]RNF03932.1 hypothetical protein TraAM80_05458 [Trypanosoma rangeli]|eukprot:RNF03932.1 hypothetical protein TraAM80_05458 [Trypanosoma rangeli]